ncbi:MAG: thioredoxin family protein [Planctomycetes bacterium]|nr:thioredoxin family protein [Planctomycetota bacterium]
MNHRLEILLLMLIVLLVLRRSHAGEADAPAGIPWAKSFAEAREASSKAGKPLLVDFEAEWCGFCKKLDRETYSDERVIRKVRERFLAVKVDVDVEPELAKKHRIEGLPTIVVLSPSGEELQRIQGFRAPELFLKDLDRSAESSASLAKLKDLAAKDPRDSAAQRAYARALFAAGNAGGAVKVLEAARGAAPAEAARAGILLDLGDALRSGGKLAEARDAYRGILAMRPEDSGEARARAFVPLANVLVSLRDAAGAIEALDLGLKEEAAKGRDRIEAFLLRAYAHAVRKDAERALADLKAVKDLDPDGRWGLRASQIVDLLETK